VLVQNANRYSTLPVEFKLVNLAMERTEPCAELLQSSLDESLGKDFFAELTHDEVVE